MRNLFLLRSKTNLLRNYRKKKIAVFETELSSLLLARDAGFEFTASEEKISKVKKALENEKRGLKRKIDAAERQKKCRNLKKQKLQRIVETNPEIAAQLSIRQKCGQPRIEESQPELLKVHIFIDYFY